MERSFEGGGGGGGSRCEGNEGEAMNRISIGRRVERQDVVRRVKFYSSRSPASNLFIRRPFLRLSPFLWDETLFKKKKKTTVYISGNVGNGTRRG